MNPTRSRATLVLGIVGSILIGVLVASQSRINGELALGLGDGYVAALISFSIGLVIMSVVLIVWAPARRGLSRVVQDVRTGVIPWWYLVGGAGGGFFVLSQGLTAAILGVALFTVAAVCGQTISGLVIDRIGIGTALPAAITWTRLIGSVLTLVAVVWAVSGDLVGDIPPWLLLLPFVAGLVVSAQQAVNGQVRTRAQSAATATFINFVMGTTVLLIVVAVHLVSSPAPTHLPTAPWLYLGGLIGTLFIGLSAVVVRMIGLLLISLGSIAGQLVTSLVLDLVLPVDGRVVLWTTIAGTLLTLVAVGIATIPSRAIRELKAPIPEPKDGPLD